MTIEVKRNRLGACMGGIWHQARASRLDEQEGVLAAEGSILSATDGLSVCGRGPS